MTDRWVPDGSGGFVKDVSGGSGWLIIGLLLVLGIGLNVLVFGFVIFLAFFIGMEAAYATYHTLMLLTMCLWPILGFAFVVYLMASTYSSK